VITLFAYGCPLQAIVHAFGLDERTVAAWQKRAGVHCKRIHEEIVQQGKVKSQHIQADEIRAKGRKIIVWIALAMDVTTRVWLAGAVSEHRDCTLIDLLLQRTRACCQLVQGLLVCTDGLASYPEKYCACVSGKSEKAWRARKMQFGSVARFVYCNGHKAYKEETGGRNNAKSDERNE
jgi:hypothetical protein